MPVFDYKQLDSAASGALYQDAMALAMYAYHGIDDGFAAGYQQHGFGLGLPATLVKALIGGSDSQGVIPGIPWNPDSEAKALAQVKAAGWAPISAAQLGYNGHTDARGTFHGETPGYTSAQVEILGRYDSNGQLSGIGIAFRGTSGPRENLLGDTLGDAVNDLLASLGPAGYARDYAAKAFDGLLGDVAAFAKANGLSGADITVSGHSLGGLAVNSLADLSGTRWGGFFEDARYVAFASPTQAANPDKVLNIGYENDPVFRALDGTSVTWGTLGVHDSAKASATDNIVNFNDHYASDAWNLLPYSIGNIATWLSHLPAAYTDGLGRVLDSGFYQWTSRDSTIVVSNLSDVTRGSTWVQDLNRNAETHKGSTFIIGSEQADLIQGGRGNDYLEGRGGNDTFRDQGGFNLIDGGSGHDTLKLGDALANLSIARDGQGTLYVRDAEGGISLVRNVESLVSQETSLVFFSKEVSHTVGVDGLLSSGKLNLYAASQSGSQAGDTLVAGKQGQWLFGLDGDDRLVGGAGNDVLVGGAGNDLLSGGAGRDTFLFDGHFGQDRVLDFSSQDRLVFMGVDGGTASRDFRDHLSQVGDDLVLTFGKDSVTLVGIAGQGLADGQIVIA
ncbi:polyurethane esterase [Pseudomonas sichuanensis]|uniref:polyurethane esterase n=1 Tax=Pseudomonas sichuanensis TaxID=2213015 RepID=UPI00215E1340|nr:polyurethanase [Pseudomonas sichuanensis]UVL87644.1 polyurethanase [Pseudomonas sichuanensis]